MIVIRPEERRKNLVHNVKRTSKVWQQMKTKKEQKRQAALCLAVVCAVSLMGCGGQAGGQRNGTLSKSAEEKKDAVAMGRYVEAVTEVDAGPVMDVRELTDGRLVLLEDGAAGRMVSADGGAVWEEDMLPDWYQLLEARYYMQDMKAAPDGSVALLCRHYGSSSTQEEAGEESDKDPSLTVREAPETETAVYLVNPAGETQWAKIALDEEEKLESLCFSEDGSRLFAASEAGKIYEIDKNTGESRMLMTVDIAPDAFCVWDNYMAVKREQEGVLLYDMDTTERIVDEVLSDFVEKNCKGSSNTILFTYTIFPAEEGSLYLACSQGIYRHVIGGDVSSSSLNTLK